MKNRFTLLHWVLFAAVLVAGASFSAQAQSVGIGTTAPTQTLDVNGQLRVRGLTGPDTRLPVVLPDGTLGVNPPVYGTTATTPAFSTAATGSVGTGTNPTAVAVSGTTAYVVNQSSNTLQAFDVANPAAPVLLGFANTGTDPYAVAVSGTTAYVVNRTSNTLQAFNVANPAAPVLLGFANTDTGPVNVAVSGTTAYVVNSTSSTLQAFNVANPAAPALLGTVATGSNPISVAVSGTTAYVVNATSNTLQAFSVANPAAPALLGTVATGTGPNGVAVSGTMAYVVNTTSNTLQAFNVANPAAPALLGTVATGAGPISVAVSGTAAYVVNLFGNTLQVFSFPGPPRAVAVNADGSFGSVALPSGADFIQNGTTPQAASNFNVSGAGTVGGLLAAGSAQINNLTTAGLVQTDASGNLSSATAASLDPTTASNGLTKTGNDFRLGGTLAGATTVAQAGNAFSLTGGSVGIGTGTPGTTLDVNGSFNVNNSITSSLQISQPTQNITGAENSGTVGQSFTMPTAGTITSFALNFTTATTVTVTFYQGVGNAGPVLGSQTATFVANTFQTVALTTPIAVPAGVYTLVPSIFANYMSNANPYPGGVLTIGTNTSLFSIYDAMFAVGYTAVFNNTTLYANAGNVGIGTATPTQKLDVNGNARIQGLTTAGLVQTDASGNLSSNSGSGSVILNQTASAQTGGFNISGAGTVGGLLTAGSASVSGASALAATTVVGNAVLNGSGSGTTSLGTGSGAGAVSIGRSGGSTNVTGTLAVVGTATVTGNVGIGSATTPTQALEVTGYAKLNGPSTPAGATVPGIATALFTGIIPNSVSSTTFMLVAGIIPARILAVTVLATAGVFIVPPAVAASTGLSGYEYGYYITPSGTTGTNFVLTTGGTSGNSINVRGKPVTVFITYMP